MLSVIIPAYNEEHRLPGYLASVAGYLERRHPGYEIIVIDDGSSDATAEVVRRFCSGNASVRLVSLPANRGKGHAVKTGMLQARGELRLFADADGATPIAEVSRLLEEIEGGAEVAIGCRARKSASCTVKAHLHRKVMGTVFNTIVSALAVPGIADTQCGFKLFTAKAATAIFPLQTLDGFGFDVELLFLCRKLGYRVSEVPVNWSDIRGSKVRLVRDSLGMLRDVFRIRGNELRGLYRQPVLSPGHETEPLGRGMGEEEGEVGGDECCSTGKKKRQPALPAAE